MVGDEEQEQEFSGDKETRDLQVFLKHQPTPNMYNCKLAV